MNKMVKAAFLGMRPLGVMCLEHLLAQTNVQVVAVVCHPREHKGWWAGDYPKEVIDVVEERGLRRVDEPDLLNIDVDIVFSVLYWRILRKPLIDHCHRRIYNLHPASLPEYRGSNSYSHAIINGEQEYGVTLHQIDEGTDTGPLVEVRRFPIFSNETARELHDRAQSIAFQLFCDRLPELLCHDVNLIPQGKEMERLEKAGHHFYSYKKTSLENLKKVGIEDLMQRPDYVWRLVRGMEFKPFEPAYIDLAGNKIYLKSKPY